MQTRPPLKRIKDIADTIKTAEQRDALRARYNLNNQPGLTLLVNDLMNKPVSAHNSVVLVEALQGQFSELHSILDVQQALADRLRELQYDDLMVKHQAGQYAHKRGAIFTPDRTQQLVNASRFSNRR